MANQGNNTENTTIETATLGEILNRVTAKHLIDTYCQDEPLFDAIDRLLRSNVAVQSEQTANDQIDVGGWYVKQSDLDKELYGCDDQTCNVIVIKTRGEQVEKIRLCLTRSQLEELIDEHANSTHSTKCDLKVNNYTTGDEIVSYNSISQEIYWIS